MAAGWSRVAWCCWQHLSNLLPPPHACAHLGRLAAPIPCLLPARQAQALQCLNCDQSRSLKKCFANVSADSAANNLAVLCCGIVLAAQAIAAAGGEVRCTGAGEEAGSGAGGGGAGGGGGVQQLQEQAALLLRFLADK